MRSFILALAVLAALAGSAFAQQGQINGIITDSTGGVVPGATVTAIEQQTGLSRDTVTGANGLYTFPSLRPTVYEIRAVLTGFRTVRRTDLALAANQNLTINITLELGELSETISVAGEAANVDVTTATLSEVVDHARIVELPLNGRDAAKLTTLVAGTVIASVSTETGKTIPGALRLSSHGRESLSVSFRLDGASNTDLYEHENLTFPFPDALQEFSVATSGLNAQHGMHSGAAVNAVTKSGSNRFAGNAFEFLRDHRFNATNPFAQIGPDGKRVDDGLKRNQFGGTLGGPIVKDKLHFFVNLERIDQNRGITINIPSRPDLNFAERTHDNVWNWMVRADHQINNNNTWAVRWLREWAPQWYTIGNRQTMESYQDETDLDQTAVGTLTSVIGDSRVNTVRVARTWEHWWHGNECFRKQGGSGDRAGFKFGDEASGSQALCAPQLNYPALLAQASTESQGPWDSNYQIEDDFSWFVPGKHGDHEFKFGTRYNYTELRRVSQINENGTFTINSDLAFDPANPRTYPERLSIRMGTFNEYIDNHTFEFYAQDKWKMDNRTTLSIGVR